MGDGLLITKKRSARLIEILRKDITKIFQKLNLQVKIELSSQSVNFLDVVMDLNNNNYHPYRKENAKEIYVNCKSNHPCVIKREIPKMIQKRLSSLSKSKDLFDIAKTPYQKPLTDSGHNTQLEFDA